MGHIALMVISFVIERPCSKHGSTSNVEQIDNIGSTGYGGANQIAECADRTIEATLYLEKYAFTKYDKSFSLGVHNWPGWMA